jgi:hypothetical protein
MRAFFKNQQSRLSGLTRKKEAAETLMSGFGMKWSLTISD